MKGFDEEYLDLVSWAIKRHEETSSIPIGAGLDGEHAAAVLRDTKEWNQRLCELQIKYSGGVGDKPMAI